MEEKYPLLNKINSPSDLKALEADKVEALNGEIREFLIDKVNQNGGHLASNLGVVELSVALHRVFDTPRDHIIWDVGHQSYVHKILTGRRDSFDTLRQAGGISGFTKRSESEHDCFGAGHSSTSISAALGFAEADKLSGNDAYTVAVVGDGAFTGGMIHEALNNCKKDLRLIIVLNENEMSISKNIGQFAKNLSKLRMRQSYIKAKKITGRVLRRIPLVGKHIFKFTLRIKKAFKNIMYGSNYFEDMGLYYLGPVDGNDYGIVEKILREAKNQGESVVVHLKTVKGKGYDPAEEDPGKYHGIAPHSASAKKKTLTDVFGETVCEFARDDKKICAITAAMSDGTGLDLFKAEFPDRFFDVGIAEEHAVTFAAGLAASGMRPLAAIYSTFLQRAYDNIIHDVALQGLPVTLCIDRSGLNSKDGATHHGIFDVAFLSQVPNMTVYTPITEDGLKKAMRAAIYSDSPAAIRYSCFEQNDRVIKEFYGSDGARKPSVVRNFKDEDGVRAVIITYGNIVCEALKAADELSKEGIKTGIILLEVLKPYGKTAELISKYIPNGAAAVFLEEGIKNGGAGMIIKDMLSDRHIEVLAIDDSFAIQSAGESVYESAGISCDDLKTKIKKII